MTVDIPERELLEYLEGELSPERRSEVAAHLESCDRCLRERDRLHGLIEAVADADPKLSELDLVGEVRTALSLGAGERPPASPRGRTRSLRLGLGAAAALLVAALAPRLTTERSEFHAKAADGKTDSTRWTGVQAYVAKDSGEVVRLGTRLEKESLMFTYSNLAARAYEYLMIFGVDASGEVRWYYPAYADPAQDPVAVRIVTGAAAVPLPDKVRHPLAKGRFVIYGLFLRRLLTVSAVEARIADLERQGHFADPRSKPPRLDLGEDAFEQMLTTEVE